MGNYAMIPFSQDNLLVLVALGLVALLALLTILGMIKGARLKSARRTAEKEEQARIDELREDGVEEREADVADASFADAPPTSPASTLAPEGQQTRDAGVEADAPSTSASDRVVTGDDAPGAPPMADEPIAAAAPLGASPASAAADAPTSDEPAPEPAAPVTDGAEPTGGTITQLKGLGPKIATRLGELGITSVDQLAWLDDAEAAELDAQLGAFQGRMERDRWREQARFLAQGDRAGYEAQFGKLG